MRQIQEMTNAPPHEPHSSAKKARLLLVEDHDVNQILIQAMTKRLGYETELATNGTEAVDRVERAISDKNPFDLVLMDIQMPEMDGYEATRMIRKGGVSEGVLPIIAITANAFGEDVRNCLAAGMQAHIAKPIDISQLDSVLQHWLKPKPLEDDCPATEESRNGLSADLVNRYRLRREEAVSSVKDFVKRGSFSTIEISELSNQMHKLAGTAAIFGEEALGNHARLVEDELMQPDIAGQPEKLLNAAERFLDAA